MRRYNRRKLQPGVAQIRHAVIDYEVAPMSDLAAKVGLAGDLVAGDIEEISRFLLQQSTAIAVATAGMADRPIGSPVETRGH